MRKDSARVVSVLLVAGARTDLTSSFGSSIRTLFFGLTLIDDVWLATCDMLPSPRHNAFASAGGGGGDVGALYIVRDVMDRICSHIGTSVDGLFIIVSCMVPIYHFGP
jgi:hypothetical protein